MTTPHIHALLNTDCLSVLPALPPIRLVHADPPWLYDNARVPRGDGSMAELPYPVLTMQEIREHMDAFFDVATPDAYLVLWSTWPKLQEWQSTFKSRWSYKTGGVWAKTGRMGLGYHWRGDSEPVLIYTKGRPKPYKAISNAYTGPRASHSEKPLPFLLRLLEGFSQPGDVVFDPYAGMAPMARACDQTGRQYVGTEIDEKRYAQALNISFPKP